MSTNVWSKKFMSQQEAIYLAGFFDGEGSLYCIKLKDKPLARGGYSIRVQASVVQTSPQVIEYIQHSCGNGRISYRKSTNPRHKDIWKILWQPNQLRHILPQILPYLIVKKAVVEKGLELLKLKENCPTYSNNTQEQQCRLYNEISALNKRGIEASTVEFSGLGPIRPKAPYERKKKGRLCELEGCSRGHYAKGMCFHHYRKANPEIYRFKGKTLGVRTAESCLFCGAKYVFSRKTKRFCNPVCRGRYRKQHEKKLAAFAVGPESTAPFLITPIES